MDEESIPTSKNLIRYLKSRAELRKLDVSFLANPRYQGLINDMKIYLDRMFLTAFMAGENKGMEMGMKYLIPKAYS